MIKRLAVYTLIGCMFLLFSGNMKAQDTIRVENTDTILKENVETGEMDTLIKKEVRVTISDGDDQEAVMHELEMEEHPEHHAGQEVGGEHHGEGHAEEHGGGHGGMEPLFFVIIALLIGAATRHFFRKIPLPFTVLLLLIGLILGALERMELFYWSQTIDEALKWAGTIDPHLILFVFLPTLIFEAAFAMDVHTFKKTATNASILAIPGIVVAMLLTGLIMIGIDKMGLGLEGWGSNMGFIALMFGAVVSATDPVAVVSLLKELGASKKLGTLIEGESLLNDGTAIVIFMVFYVPLTVIISTTGIEPEVIKNIGEILSGVTPESLKAAAESVVHADPTALASAASSLGVSSEEVRVAADNLLSAGGSPLVSFIKVAMGGVLLGVVIGSVTLAWVKRVFNDMLIEISVIVAAAYITFYIAEDFMHVSGVLGLVSLGLAMAGVGKTRISPEVQHFLHEFWEMAAFIANTLIFIIVGLVIAQRIEFTGNDFIILGILYIGIHVVRALVIAMFYPLMKKFGYGLDVKNAVVIWYGALRGAIGLALALVVANVDYSVLEANGMADILNLSGAEHFDNIKNEFLFLTAGIVTLTLLINATTIKFVVNKLGLTKVAPAKALMIVSANQYLRTASENQLERLKSDRFISNANWSQVKEYLPKDVEEYNLDEQIETISEMRKRCLEKEKSSYWHQFKDGLLGPVAVRRLSDSIDGMLDEGGLQELSHRKDLELLMKTPKLLSRLQTVPLLKNITRHLFFERLAVSYDCARGFIDAQEDVIKLVESMYRSLEDGDEEGNKNLGIIENEINENKIEGLTFIRNLKKTYPEIYDAIATRQAIRMLLNYELKTVERLQKNGRIDSGEAAKMIHTIEERMKKLMHKPPKVKVPEAIDFLKEVSWLEGFSEDQLDRISRSFSGKIFTVGNKLMKEGAASDGVYLIARGSAKITQDDEIIDLVGEGSIVGEMGVLTKKQRNAGVEAESPLTTFYMSAANLQVLMDEIPELKQRLWKITSERYAANCLKSAEPYTYWRPKKFKKWLTKGELMFLKPGESHELKDKIGILCSGLAKVSGSSSEIKSPTHIEVHKFEAVNECAVFLIDKSDE